MGTRKDFLKKSALGVGGLALGFSPKSYSQILGANDRIKVAFIGCGRRVPAYYESLSDQYNTELAYICDVKKSQRERVANDLKDKIPNKPTLTEDLREVFDDPAVDAVFVATPDHWHTPAALLALQQGKHVYVEKPCSHNPGESEMLVSAQKKYGKVVQMGDQQRSSPHSIEIINQIHDGIIGNAYKAVAFYNNSRGRTPNPVQEDPPSDLNWKLFQGPAPHEKYRDDTWDYNWHWYGWKWGTAEAGNNATHEIDVARWALQVDYPKQAYVDAAKHHFLDDGWEMYDTMYATFKFPDNKVINWDGKSRNGYQTYGSGRGTIIYGTEGSVFVNRSEYRLYDREGEMIRKESSGGEEQGTALGGGGSMSTKHVVNFLDTIRGTAEEQHAPIEDAAKSVHMIHLANIAYRVDKPLMVDTADGHIDDKEAMEYWDREYEPGWEPTE